MGILKSAFKAPAAIAAAPVPEPLPPAPTQADPSIAKARKRDRRIAALALGRQGDILTGGLASGLTTKSSSAAGATLLGG